jgi:oxygen-independent coproporphyrinogen-3 oxidase
MTLDRGGTALPAATAVTQAAGDAQAAGEALPPLALYVHFPWCVRKCPYCDFNSHALHGELPERAYLDALLQDLDAQLGGAVGGSDERTITSVFFGGGTPSLISAAAIADLLATLRRRLRFADDAEITLEANPGTIEHGRFAEYRAAGVNRVSLGAQSFAPDQLVRLGRIHSAADTLRAAEELHAAGLRNFNVDLMYALPEQDLNAALADIDAALALQPAHISHYQLTLEPGTVFGGRPPAGLPDIDLAARMQELCQGRLAAAGYAQYEVSAYARSGARCRHNLNYWSFGDYLGLGAGAHGKHSRALPVGLRIERTWREREPRRYIASAAQKAASRAVHHSELPFEFMMNALRLVEGFSTSQFEQRTGLAFACVADSVAGLQDKGLLTMVAGRWRATPLGFDFLNDLLTAFLPPRGKKNPDRP